MNSREVIKARLVRGEVDERLLTSSVQARNEEGTGDRQAPGEGLPYRYPQIHRAPIRRDAALSHGTARTHDLGEQNAIQLAARNQ